MTKGRVKYFNDLKGWGFITSQDIEQDIFVHYTAIKMEGFKTLKEGQEVVYELMKTEQGPRALNVVLAEQSH
ncbi:MAG TPA: cold shock domain-containing protein [candidate division Zixibacteria bacterium]|nr:cold shock domain-containing protein [candidate division Zixibacteria bacterium]